MLHSGKNGRTDGRKAEIGNGFSAFSGLCPEEICGKRSFSRALREELENGFSGCTGDEAVCMKFLYGTMPLRDAGEYAFSTFLGFVRHALWLRENVEWCKSLPEDIFAIMSFPIG